jgi:hypothetical protein
VDAAGYGFDTARMSRRLTRPHHRSAPATRAPPAGHGPGRPGRRPTGLRGRRGAEGRYLVVVQPHPGPSERPRSRAEGAFVLQRFFFERFRNEDCTDRDRAGTGEWTPSYLFSYRLPPVLRRAAPDAMVLIPDVVALAARYPPRPQVVAQLRLPGRIAPDGRNCERGSPLSRWPKWAPASWPWSLRPRPTVMHPWSSPRPAGVRPPRVGRPVWPAAAARPWCGSGTPGSR